VVKVQVDAERHHFVVGLLPWNWTTTTRSSADDCPDGLLEAVVAEDGADLEQGVPNRAP
jgi:hypothetical protein